MKKHLLFLLVAFLSLNCFPQIEFEKGYFINDNNERIECLIKNLDWKNNPIDFKYKFSDTSQIQAADIHSVKEFGINNISKYERAVVNMDRSSEDVPTLSSDRNPVFQEEVLFLKALLEGQASLFIYEEKNLTRFFYKINDSSFTQLVYKMYTRGERQILYNYHFRQQLLTDLKCGDISIQDIESLNYYENELVRFFIKYNECQNASFKNYQVKYKKNLFNLSLRPGLNISSLSMDNPSTDEEDNDFGSDLTFRAGLEFELIFPFNKNKWALMIEPTYQYYKAEKESEGINDQQVEVDYKSIELPLGIRHYFYLNEKSRIFCNVSYVFDFCINSSIKYELGWEFEIDTFGNFAMGLGYKYSKFSAELRYQTSRHVLYGYPLWNSDYKTFSVIFGYSIF
jgi:hypothetical protein